MLFRSGLAVAGWKLVPLKAWLPVILCGPPAGYVALRWLDRFNRFARETAGLWMAMTGTRKRLNEARRQIAERLARLDQEPATS